MSDNPHAKAYYAGYMGFLRDEFCPHAAGSDNCLDWHQGWADAYDDEYSDHEEDEY